MTIDELISTLPYGEQKKYGSIYHKFPNGAVYQDVKSSWTDFTSTGKDATSHMTDRLGPHAFTDSKDYPRWRMYH